ncbi:MAG: MgtC/SapB family protein [Nanoarchaeota archaeon]|nr:MgtC/SapB family protein [Nanoarchaeota archaeon]
MDITIIERFLVVFVLTFIYGLERQRSHKPIGFGTFILVALGACGLAITADQLGIANSIGLLGAIVTGIGFLGAGALIRTSDKIFGFTTAASIWLFSIFGMLIGLNMYYIGLIIYLLVWIVVFTDRYLEKRFIGSYRKEISINTRGFVEKTRITEVLSKYCTSFKLINVGINRKNREVKLKYLIEGLKKDIESLLKEFYGKKWCNSVELG